MIYSHPTMKGPSVEKNRYQKRDRYRPITDPDFDKKLSEIFGIEDERNPLGQHMVEGVCLRLLARHTCLDSPGNSTGQHLRLTIIKRQNGCFGKIQSRG